MNTPSLSELQVWFLTAIMTPGGVGRGLALAQERHGLAEHEVLRAAGAAGSRLHVYADGYVLRLLECMRADYPVLCKVMGRELFDFFAKAYVWRHPSRSTTLYDLGAGFAGFLAESQPAGMNAEAAQGFAFPVQLARLERALAEAGRAPGLEPGATSAATAAAAADGAWLLSGADAAVGLAPCTRLLELSFPLHAYWKQLAASPPDAAPPAMPAAATTFVAIGRLHYRVNMHVLAPWQFHFLQAAKARAPARQCALHAARACGMPAGRVLADALLWLPLAAAAALVRLEQA